ncbi:MAG: hypothetical protein WC443_10105 [Desulfobaccales bacterium]
MADTVKTRVMKALEAVLKAGLPEVKTVERRKPEGTDLDKIALPALFFYDDSESGKMINRLRLGLIPLEIAVFFRLAPGKDNGRQAFNDLADTIAGRVYPLIQTSPALRGLVLKVKEEDSSRDKGIAEPYAWLVLRYSITYGHAAGDAFTTQVA